VVDNQSHGDWNVFVLEEADSLQYTVLANFKILLVQIGDKAALTIGDRSVQHHQSNVYGDSEIWPWLWHLISDGSQGKKDKGRESERFRHAALSGP
jgi:hypothetical protein